MIGIANWLNSIPTRFRAWKHGRTWEYGSAGPGMCRARRHKTNGNVQFVLWKAGEQGHQDDYWHNFDSSWWRTFQADAAQN